MSCEGMMFCVIIDLLMKQDAGHELPLPILDNPSSTAIRFDERQELLKKAQYLLPSFKKMGYKERLEYARWNPELYSKLIDLENKEPETPTPKDRPHFIKMTDAKIGETKYIYIKG